MKRLLLIVGVIFSISTTWAQTLCEQNPVYGGLPRLKSQAGQITVLTNCAYVVGYSETRKNPLWVCYHLRKKGNVGEWAPNPERQNRFRIDDRTLARVTKDSFHYTLTRMDRGHMAPSYGIGSRYGLDAQDETFFMSNMAPQLDTLNRNTWRWLEETEANVWANGCEEVWIITGPIFKTDRRIPESEIPIPDAFYKIIIDELDGSPRAMAFRMEQGTQPTKVFDKFLIKVKDLEKLTGLDFFPALTSAVQARLEKKAPRVVWKVE